MTMFAWNHSDVVKNSSFAYLWTSILSLCTYVLYIRLDLGRIVSNRRATIIALFGFVVFYLLSYSWPFLPGELVTYTNMGKEMLLHKYK